MAVLAEAALAEPDSVVANTIRWALAGAGDAGVPALANALDSADLDRSRRAVSALEKIHTPASLRVLSEALGHADQWVSDRAALAAGAIGDASAVAALVSMVSHARYDVEAAEVLGALAADPALADQSDRAIGTRLDDAEQASRIRLATALGEIGSAQALRRLSALTRDPDRQVALTARHALANRQGND